MQSRRTFIRSVAAGGFGLFVGSRLDGVTPLIARIPGAFLDPLILPKGISGTDDPVLHARSSVYSESFNRREREISQGKAQNASAR